MEAFLISTGLVAIAEFGDKTQLLTLLLAARYRKPKMILLAILAATIFNHALAALLGANIDSLINPDYLPLILGVSFLAMAGWTLIPDKLDEDENLSMRKRGAFTASFIAFFIAEIGDKTQLATVGLAAHYNAVILVTMGTTLGMMIANVPAVILGDFGAKKLPLKLLRSLAAVFFLLLAGLAFWNYLHR